MPRVFSVSGSYAPNEAPKARSRSPGRVHALNGSKEKQQKWGNNADNGPKRRKKLWEIHVWKDRERALRASLKKRERRDELRRRLEEESIIRNRFSLIRLRDAALLNTHVSWVHWNNPARTSSERLGQHLGGEGGFGSAAAAAVLPLLRQVFAQHVPPPAVQEAVEDVRGDHVRQGARRTLKSRLESQSVGGEHWAHVRRSKKKM